MSSKVYLLLGVVALAGMTAVIVYLNKQPKASPPRQQATLPKQVETPDSEETEEWHPRPFPEQKKPQPNRNEPAASKEVEIERFINNPAVTHRIERMVTFEQELLEREKEYLSPEEWNEHAERFHSKLTKEALYERYRTLVSEKLTAEDLRSLNESYPDFNSLHDAKHRLEEYQQTPGGEEEYINYLNSFETSSLPPERLKAIEQLGQSLSRFDGGGMDLPTAFTNEEGKLYPDQVAYLHKMLEGKSEDEIQKISSRLTEPAAIKEAQLWSDFSSSLWDERN